MEIASHDGDDPRMAGDHRTAESSLIASGRYDDYVLSCCMVQGHFQVAMPVGRRMSEPQAQIQDMHPSIDTIDNRLGKR
jgi:hypothetical protein